MTYRTVPLPKPHKPNKQVQEYLDAFNRGGRLVMPNEGGWRVVRPGNQGSSLFSTEQEAVAKAKQELAKDKGELFVFDKTGQLIDTLDSQKSA